MKTNIILVLALLHLLALQGPAQHQWVEPGSVWHYQWNSFWIGAGYETVTYTSDTTINSTTCHKLERSRVYITYETYDTVFESSPPEYVYQSGDTLWRYDAGEFKVLYNMNQNVGDTLHFMNLPGEDILNIVESVKTVTINALELREFVIGFYFFDDKIMTYRIVEKLGPIGWPFFFFWDESSPIWADASEWTFRCYSDDNFPIFNPGESECDPLPNVSNTGQNINTPVLNIYPNPFHDKITIDTENAPLQSVGLYDIYGRVKFFNESDHTIELDQLPPGTYLLKAVISGQTIVRKVIKGN